uniref:Uncharacterized protein n=1 Tax=Chlorobium phaeobacteroides (strain BS1) TaxID=331678 RepID=B3EP87_CHLPB
MPFNEEAEQLAFAHNIKTISYKNMAFLRPLKSWIEQLERNYFSARNCLSRDNQKEFMRLFRGSLVGEENALLELQMYFRFSHDLDDVIKNLRDGFIKIRSSFIANSSAGAMMHFVGANKFPEELFTDTDQQLCQVYYESSNTDPDFYLVFSEDPQKRRFYFSPPVSLSQSVFFGAKEALNEKEKIFKTLHTARKIRGIMRSLVFELDTDWLEWARARVP